MHYCRFKDTFLVHENRCKQNIKFTPPLPLLHNQSACTDFFFANLITYFVNICDILMLLKREGHPNFVEKKYRHEHVMIVSLYILEPSSNRSPYSLR